jgi:hypothetical protein
MKKSSEALTKTDVLTFIIISVLILSATIFGGNITYPSEIDEEIINNRSFVGEVIEKDIMRQRWLTIIPMRSYRLYIIGEYLSDDNEMIQVDRYFNVSKEIYNRYEVGDVISH